MYALGATCRPGSRLALEAYQSSADALATIFSYSTIVACLRLSAPSFCARRAPARGGCAVPHAPVAAFPSVFGAGIGCILHSLIVRHLALLCDASAACIFLWGMFPKDFDRPMRAFRCALFSEGNSQAEPRGYALVWYGAMAPGPISLESGHILKLFLEF